MADSARLDDEYSDPVVGVGSEECLLDPVFRALVSQSPISTWIADLKGNAIFLNAACRQLFSIDSNDQIIGNYNLFQDDELERQGLLPEIRRVFDEGVTFEATHQYDFRNVSRINIPRATELFLRVFVFPVKDTSGRVKFVVIQHEDFTDKFVADQALSEAESKYRSLVEESLVGVYVVQGDRFTYVNPRFAEIFGYSQDEITDHKTVKDLIVPEDVELVTGNLRKRYEGAVQSLRYTFRGLRKDGQVVDVEVHGTRTVFQGKPAVIGSLLDITERKKAEKTLQLFQQASESSVDGILIANDDGKIIYTNPSFATMHGYLSDELQGQDIFVLYNDSTVLDTVLPTVLQSGGWFGDTIGRKKNGTTFIEEQRFSTVCRPGMDDPVIIAVSRDVTQERQAQESRRRMEAHFEEQQRQFYRQTILAATGGKLVVCDRDEIARLQGDVVEQYVLKTSEDASLARHRIRSAAMAHGMSESRADSLSLCVGEAATNALKHAGGGEVMLLSSGKILFARISDNGPGMDALILPRATLELGYSTGKSLGMGYAVILALSDKVYLDTGPTGTTIVIEMEVGAHISALSIDALPDTW